MKCAATAAVLAALVVAVPNAVGKASSSSISVGVSQRPVAFGFSITVSGQVAGTNAPGALVTLQAKSFGSNSYTNVQSTTASSTGGYTFSYFPPRNTVVRAVANTAPKATSPGVFVGVRPFVGLRVGTVRPSKGQLVQYMGIVNPAFDGKLVLIQRRNVNGGWSTFAAARLFAATPGSHGPRSQYFRRVQIKRSGTFRVAFPAPPGWFTNYSRTRTLIVH
jgi:hypothetical protein